MKCFYCNTLKPVVLNVDDRNTCWDCLLSRMGHSCGGTEAASLRKELADLREKYSDYHEVSRANGELAKELAQVKREREEFEEGSLQWKARAEKAESELSALKEREGKMNPPDGAFVALSHYQQADADGISVTVSRQAVEEAVAWYASWVAALKPVCPLGNGGMTFIPGARLFRKAEHSCTDPVKNTGIPPAQAKGEEKHPCDGKICTTGTDVPEGICMNCGRTLFA